MRLQTPTSNGKRDTCLHLLLAAGILLYVYTPFLDHWLDKDVYSRPHTHINFTVADSLSHSMYHGLVGGDSHVKHAEHDENVLCLLNIDALLSLLLFLFIAPYALVAAPDKLEAGPAPTCFAVSLVYLSSLDPPPNF